MTGEVYKRAAARRDLVQHFVYLAENAGLDTADRFLANAERCFNDLAEQPAMGSPLTLKRPELAGMRKWRVPDFENFLIILPAAPRRHLGGPRAVCRAGLVEPAGDHLSGSRPPYSGLARSCGLAHEATHAYEPLPGELEYFSSRPSLRPVASCSTRSRDRAAR